MLNLSPDELRDLIEGISLIDYNQVSVLRYKDLQLIKKKLKEELNIISKKDS